MAHNELLAILGAEDVTQTPSKFWPEGYEMLFGIPASLIVFFLLWKFAGPAIKKGMAVTHGEDPGESWMPVRRIESLPRPRGRADPPSEGRHRRRA